MPGLFEQFPHTNLHELNLDWIIDLLNQFKQELEDRAVISVNGMTGEVVLYESENVILPALPEGVNQWRLVRLVNGQYVGILFYNGNAYLQRGNETMRLLTREDIPTSAGVVSWNGMTGVVEVTGSNINRSATNPISIDQSITNEHVERVNADNVLQNSISTLNQAMTTSMYSASDAFTEHTDGTITSNYSFASKSVNTVYMQLYVTANTSSSLVTVASLKPGFIPKTNGNLLLVAFDETSKAAVYCTINRNNGQISIYGAQSGHKYIISTTYVC